LNTPSSGGQPDGEESSRLFAKIADTFREKGDLDRAVEILNRGLAENPDHITARIILAACLTERGDLDGAHREYEQVLKLDPFHTAAMKKVGILLLDMGKSEEAKVQLTRYIEELPGDAGVRKLLEDLEGSPVEDKDPTEAECCAAEDGVVDDGIGESVQTTAEAAVETPVGTTEVKSEGDKKELVPSAEDELIATMTLAEIYASQGFYDKAIEIYQKILIREPTNEIAKKRIEAIKRGNVIEKGTSAGFIEKVKNVDHTGGGIPGEIVADDEYENFRKWLVGLTKKKGSGYNRR